MYFKIKYKTINLVIYTQETKDGALTFARAKYESKIEMLGDSTYA
jgi:hypothetical protein